MSAATGALLLNITKIVVHRVGHPVKTHRLNKTHLSHSRLTRLTQDSLVGCSDNGQGSGNSSCGVRCFESWTRHCRIKVCIPAICICCLPPHPRLHLIHSCGGLQRITRRVDRLAEQAQIMATDHDLYCVYRQKNVRILFGYIGRTKLIQRYKKRCFH